MLFHEQTSFNIISFNCYDFMSEYLCKKPHSYNVSRETFSSCLQATSKIILISNVSRETFKYSLSKNHSRSNHYIDIPRPRIIYNKLCRQAVCFALLMYAHFYSSVKKLFQLITFL